MTADAHGNFSYSRVAVAPSPADSGTTLSVSPGEGILFPVPPFNCTVWPNGVFAKATNAEIVRVTAIPTTSIDVGSDGDVLPQATIHVDDESAFDSGGGTVGILLTDGSVTAVTFTGVASGQLTGCTGGAGTLATGLLVVGDAFTISRLAETAPNAAWGTNRSIIIGNQIEATITNKTLMDAEAGSGGGGSAFPDSWLLATQVTPLSASGPFEWSSTGFDGSDLEVDGGDDTQINILTDGIYEIFMQFLTAGDATGAGNIEAVLGGAITTKDWLNFFTSDLKVVDTVVPPSYASVKPLYVPPIALTNGDSFNISASIFAGAGSISMSQGNLLVRRLN